MYATVQAANNQANAAVNQTNTVVKQEDVAKSLRNKGVYSRKVDGLAEAIAARLNDQELTRSQRSFLSFELGSPAVQDVISEFIKKKAAEVDSTQSNVYDEDNIVSGLETRDEATLWDLARKRVATFGNQDYGTVPEGFAHHQDRDTFSDVVYESDTDALDELQRNDEIVVEFIYNSKYDTIEFARQIAEQQKGMKNLTVQEYLENRRKYIEQGRTTESNAAQQAAREKAFADKVDELQDAGLSLKEAEGQAKKWLDTQAALHIPDQVAGGYSGNVGGVGDKGVNSSIGAQWRYRISEVDAKIQKIAESMSEAEKISTCLNIKLICKGE